MIADKRPGLGLIVSCTALRPLGELSDPSGQLPRYVRADIGWRGFLMTLWVRRSQALVQTPGKLDPLASVLEYVTVRDSGP